MKSVLLRRAIKLNREHKRRKGWQRVVSVLAAGAVFVTTYALILPAITMERKAVCGFEAHEHTEACYEQQPVYELQCTLGDTGDIVLHSHNEACFDGAGNRLCTLPEIVAHTHSDACYETRDVVCELPEGEGHTHSDDCAAAVSVQVCTLEESQPHTHGEGCYDTEGNPVCALPEGEGHTHGEGCYESQAGCTLPETAPHTHSDACTTSETVQVCALEEYQLHTHEESCYDTEGNLTCTLPQVIAHDHAACRVATEQTVPVLTCQIPEHIHEDACYPLEEDTGMVYLCASGEHTHGDSCVDEAGVLTCSIPVHTHEAACIVADLDMTADVETQAQWEATMDAVTLTGDWSADVLAIAESQLGYQESQKNVVLVDGELKGYTRYGQWYGLPYGDWCAMFAAFCMNYAGVEDVPVDARCAEWIAALEEQGLYRAKDTYEPKPGDLIFFDYDLRDDPTAAVVSDHVGIVAEVIPATAETTAKIQTIEGNSSDRVATVTYELDDAAIIGYGLLPENPLSQEEWSQAETIRRMLELLPDADAVSESLQTLNEAGDKAGYEALRQELVTRMDTITEQYEAFNDLQKSHAGTLDRLEALKAQLGGESWKDFPTLTDDSAVVSGLAASAADIISDSDTAADMPQNAVRNGDRIEYTFTVDMTSYYTDIQYGEARVKMELVLPFAKDRAAFDTAAMTWLEDSRLTTEVRSVNGTDTTCQVLTGYKHLTTDDASGVVVPGSFTETVSVRVLALSHGEKLAVIISAAMEHSGWNGLCETHQIEEKLSVVTEVLTLYAPLSAEEQQANYEAYQQQLDALEAAGDVDADKLDTLRGQIAERYTAGALSAEQYGLLDKRVLEMTGLDLESIAEPSVGDGWIWMDFGPSDIEVSSVALFSTAQTDSIPTESAMPMSLYRGLGLDSNSQIPDDGWGGENSADDAIWVSKTIEGTEQENVFDITLQIITKEEVNEVYKEPDMAVVIVMDISNTMTSVFSGEDTVTRYDAAMDSAEQFMLNFAEHTDGISKLGYVAFNTHGHEVFPMQKCSTTAKAQELANIMRTETQSIMTEAANKMADKKYSSSHERFTNIEAGLKMAADMLDDVSNQHKYIIFLSDGFPTTYLTASTTDGYDGYDPYTTSDTNGSDGVFYDAVMGVYCDYGTSYSDTAAIKARQMAVSLKNQGINIFSIGVDVEGQTIWEYHYDSANRLKSASTVERRQDIDYYNKTGYEIGTKHSEFASLTSLTAAQRTEMAKDFKDWLEGTSTTGIGSGYYFESTDQDGLEEAYNQIFQKILDMNAESALLDWVATDPMPDMGVHELETVEFIGFWDVNGVLQQSLVGESKNNALYENTATFDIADSTILWDLKNSGYLTVNYGNNKNYMCALKYRIRLQNENTGFIERQIYDTNNVTSLAYRIIEVINGTTQVSDRKYIEFPIPKVFGYLSELNFMKVDPSGNALPGAKFTLTHDTESCGTCRGDGVGYVDLPVYEASSGADGMVRFTNIPSGHHYTLTEVEAPENYILTKNTYKVVVSYDALTVTVLDADGNPLEWTESIENDTYYALPNTGGMGTSHFTFGGLLIIAGALMYVIYFGRKRKKGGA